LKVGYSLCDVHAVAIAKPVVIRLMVGDSELTKAHRITTVIHLDEQAEALRVTPDRNVLEHDREFHYDY
jgi:hypothetical protein